MNMGSQMKTPLRTKIRKCVKLTKHPQRKFIYLSRESDR